MKRHEHSVESPVELWRNRDGIGFELEGSRDARKPSSLPPRRVIHITTVPDSLIFLRGQGAFLRERGWELQVISAPGPQLDQFRRDEGVECHAVPMERRITPLSDLRALTQLIIHLRAERPHIVHASTPKAGLLGTIAARLSGVPTCVYHMRGLPMATAVGWKRELLRTTERLSCGFAHHVLCVSSSLRDVAIAERICAHDAIEVLGSGSGQGVEALTRFDPERAPGTRHRVRAELGIDEGSFVVGFVGRLVRDKGIIELAEAWNQLKAAVPTARLLLVGGPDVRDPVPPEILGALSRDLRVVSVGYRDDTAPLYAAMDVLALPTYREGFPNVALEAASMGLPIVASRVTGCVDAVVDGETGLLIPAFDADALAHALLRYASSATLRQRHGLLGRQRVLRDFRRELVWENLLSAYQRWSA